MNKTPAPPLSFDRDEVAEILSELAHAASALELLPYRTALDPIRRLGEVCYTLQAAFPGGFAGECEFCKRPIGVNEIGMRDDENGGIACNECGAAEREAQAKEASELSLHVAPPAAGRNFSMLDMAVDIAEGWVEWRGGECPLHPDAVVEYQTWGGEQFACEASLLRWTHRGESDDIIFYRLAKAAVAPVTITTNDPPAEPIDLGHSHRGPHLKFVVYDHLGMGRASDEPIFDTAPLEPPVAPRFDPSALIDWSSNADAQQALADGKLPEGYRVEDGVLIVPERPWAVRGASATFAAFSEVRNASGKVLKTANPYWAPPEAEELQLLRQLNRLYPVDWINPHPATLAIALRLEAALLARWYPGHKAISLTRQGLFPAGFQ